MRITNSPSPSERSALLATATQAAKAAGSILVEHAKSGFQVDYKTAINLVTDADRPPPARFDRDFDPSRPGVNRIFDQLLDDGGRPLDHLPGGDLVRKTVWKNSDF